MHSSNELRSIDRRRTPRRKTYLGGRIIHSPGRTPVDCTIRNMSQSGATVRLAGDLDLSEPVYLLDLTHGLAFAARIVWQSDDLTGLEFRGYFELPGNLADGHANPGPAPTLSGLRNPGDAPEA
ncbi:MAG: PilZ domain-containing protein [Caulobacterales bacterium]